MAKNETITGWVARDEKGSLCLYNHKPTRYDSFNESMGNYWYSDELDIEVWELPGTMFPELTWKEEPVYVKLTIEVLQ